MAPPLQKRERVGEKSPRKAYINISPGAPYKNYPMALNPITQVPIVTGGLPGRRPFQPETRVPCCRTALLAGVLARAPMGPAPVPATGVPYVGVPRGGAPKGATVGVGAGFQRLRPGSHPDSRASGGGLPAPWHDISHPPSAPRPPGVRFSGAFGGDFPWSILRSEALPPSLPLAGVSRADSHTYPFSWTVGPSPSCHRGLVQDGRESPP